VVKRNESAANPLNFDKYGERSQTISKESTPNDNGGSGEPLTDNSEGEDIVESRSKKFFEKSVEKHGLIYNYDRVVYKNAKTKVLIGCDDHGYFEQTPDKHLNSTYCCPLCNDLSRRERIKNIKRTKPTNSFDEFLKKIHKKYGNIEITVIGTWLGIVRSKVNVICPKHGITESTARNLIQPIRQYSCQICSIENRLINKVDTKAEIINELNQLFEVKYEYQFPTSYRTKRDSINVICPKHGEFKRKVQKLLVGQYCSKCKMENLINNNILVGGYSENLFEKKPELKDIDGLLYYLEINNGQYYKIGITKCDTSYNRVKSLKSKSRGSIKIIKELKIKKLSLYDAFCIEQKILKENNDLRVLRSWSTELFKKDISEHILHYFT
jgi:hypothetical protein